MQTPNWGVILFSKSKFCVEKQFKKQKKTATVGRFAINPSCLYLGDIHNHWTIESLFKFDKPNLSPFEGIPGGWDGGGGFGENFPVDPWFCFFCEKRTGGKAGRL